MAAFGEAPFVCPVCGASCRAVFKVNPSKAQSFTGSGAPATLTVQLGIDTVTGCEHVESKTHADDH